MKSCNDGASVITTLPASVPLSIRYSYAAGATTCFAVTATVDGKPVDGYLLGDTHPAIAAFEHDVQQAKVIPPPPPPPPPAPEKAVVAKVEPTAPPAPPPPPQPLSFAGFRATTIQGERVDFNQTRAANVVVYFWSTGSRKSIALAEQMEGIYEGFHNRGVEVVGIASAPSRTRLADVCRDSEFIWPQVLDAGFESRYHVDPANPYLVLDRSRNVIAAVPAPQDLFPVLEKLTKGRKRL